MKGRSATHLLCIAVLLMTVALPGSAVAKGDGPLWVMTPSGEVFRVEGNAADLWWRDWAGAPRGGCACRSPEAGAKYAGRILAQWGTPLPPTYQITAGRELPMTLFAPADKRLWFLVSPGGHGSVEQGLWSRWTRAGPAIIRIIATGEEALSDAPPGASVTVSTLDHAAVTGPPVTADPPVDGGGAVVWIVAPAAGLLVIASLLLVLLRRRSARRAPVGA